MPNDLEQEKLRAEIAKLQAEIRSLRRPLHRPLNWLLILIAVAGMALAIGQWQVSSIKEEQAALGAERRLFESEQAMGEKEAEIDKLLAQLQDSKERENVLHAELARIESRSDQQSFILRAIEEKVAQNKKILDQKTGRFRSENPGQQETFIEEARGVDPTIQDDLGHLAVVWKGKVFRRGDRVRIASWSGTIKPDASGHSKEVDSGPGQIGTILAGRKRKATSFFTPDPDEPIQIVLVRWDRQEWQEHGGKKPVVLDVFEDIIHVDYLEVISKAQTPDPQ